MSRGASPGASRVATSHSHTDKKKGHKKLRRIAVEPAMNGGYVAEHSYHESGGEYSPPETHAFGSAKDLHEHLQKHIPMVQDDEAAEGEA
jgi:hypothetical protein